MKKKAPRPRFAVSDLVELLESDGPSRGRVVESLDDGRRVYVRWTQRNGSDGRVTLERASALRESTSGLAPAPRWPIDMLRRWRTRARAS